MLPSKLTALAYELADAFSASVFYSDCYLTAVSIDQRWVELPPAEDRSPALRRALRWLREREKLERHPEHARWWRVAK